MNTFQAVVVGDANKRTIKVQYAYQDKEMNWRLAIYGAPNIKFYPARIGTMFNGNGAQAVEYKASGIRPDVSVNNFLIF